MPKYIVCKLYNNAYTTIHLSLQIVLLAELSTSSSAFSAERETLSFEKSLFAKKNFEPNRRLQTINSADSIVNNSDKFAN